MISKNQHDKIGKEIVLQEQYFPWSPQPTSPIHCLIWKVFSIRIVTAGIQSEEKQMSRGNHIYPLFKLNYQSTGIL